MLRSVFGRAGRTFACVAVLTTGQLAATPTAAGLGAAQREPPALKATLAIVGGTLLDGHEGAPIHRSVILIDGKKIVAVGTVGTLKVPAGVKVIDAAGYTVMPGLIDSHVHLDLMGHADYVAWHKKHTALGPTAEAEDALSARQLLMAGVTTAVDLGGAPATIVKVRDRINRGELVGPRMKVSAGWIWNAPAQVSAAHHRGMEGYLLNAHTVEEARAAILKNIELGADIIKAYNGLTAEQTKVVTEEAHKKGLRVTGHGQGDADVLMKIANGQDGFEHLGFNPDNTELVRQLVARRTFIDPTPVIQALGPMANASPEIVDNPRFKALMPADLYAEIRESIVYPERLSYFGRAIRPSRYQKELEGIKKLRDAGVRLLVGTDSGTPINFHTDSTRQEMLLLAQAGIPSSEVIGMATRVAAEWLGMSDSLGTIEPGKFADIIVVDGNPLIDLGVLKHVVHVVKEGVQYKGPGTEKDKTSTTDSK
jgi:imidazolonepropionase-like amidohydrolase